MNNVKEQFGLSAKVVPRLQDVFKKYPVVEEVILFGSRAKGNCRKGSDIDLSLRGEIDYNTLSKIETEIDDLLLAEMVDLNRYNDLKNEALKEHINRVGKVFYEKSPSTQRGN